MQEVADTDGLWSPARRALTGGLVLTITLVAFESLAVATILPDVEDDLGGLGLYGWVFSAFFLGNLVGVVAAGQTTDRRGPATAYLLGLGLFVIGLVAGGLAPSMLVLVLARFVQGFGAGAVPATAYATIGRAYPERLRPRVFAVMSTAWVVPGLLGPGASSAISAAFGWRWVFLGLVPLALIAGAIALRPLRPLDIDPSADVTRPPSRLPAALRVAAGAGLVLGGLSADTIVLAVPLVVLGLVLGSSAFLSLVPDGTLRGAPGLPAAVAVRGILTFAFFGADAYLPLAITDGRGSTTLVAGLTLTASAITWTAGSWVQERWSTRLAPDVLVSTGHLILLGGIALAAVALFTTLPLALFVVAWTVAGFGIGLAYSPISVTVLREAPSGQEGAATSGMQLTDTLGITLGTGLGGAAVGLGDAVGWAPESGIGIAWAMTAVMCIVGVVVGRRLPGLPVQPEERRGVPAEDGGLPLG